MGKCLVALLPGIIHVPRGKAYGLGWYGLKQFERTNSGKDLWGNLAIYLVAAISFYLYAWFVIKPELVYHSFGRMTEFPMFYFSREFFQKLAMHPGGSIQYLSNFLSQLLFYRWAGALVVAATAFSMGWCFLLFFLEVWI